MTLPTKSTNEDTSIRLGFIRKVMLLLLSQIGISFICFSLFQFHAGLAFFVERHSMLVSLSSLVSLVALVGVKSKFPLNLLTLSFLSVTTSLKLADTISDVDIRMVAYVAFLTLSLFSILFVGSFFITPSTKSALRTLIFSSFVFTLLSIPLSLFFDFPLQRSFFYSLQLVTCCIVLLLNLNRLLLKSKVEDAVLATALLYLELVRLFVKVLQVAGSSKTKKSKKK
ncbi:hypothetical protein RCL1_001494 [Eukaryota sp. TZLM3-RCL]